MRDLDFDSLHCFARVAAAGTLSAVARERAVPVSQVSRTLARIEAACGVKLVRRSTHGLSLTPEGDTFLAHCHAVLGTLDALESDFAEQSQAVAGTVRLAVSPAMAHFILIPALPALAARHPQLAIDLLAGDGLVDLARDGVDIAVRSGAPQVEHLVARPIGAFGRALYASPGYLAAHGTPATPDALAAHHLIANSAMPALNRWPFRGADGGEFELAVQGHWRASSTGLMMTMVLNSLGICRCNTAIAAPLVAAGQLQPVLAAHTAPRSFPIHAIVPPQRERLPKVQAAIDWLAGTFDRLAP